jgi:hypothetical protein
MDNRRHCFLVLGVVVVIIIGISTPVFSGCEVHRLADWFNQPMQSISVNEDTDQAAPRVFVCRILAGAIQPTATCASQSRG